MSNSGSTTYPGTLDTFNNPVVNVTLENEAGYSHAALHSQVHDAIEAIESTLGTTGGTSTLKNFVAGDFAARVNGETLGTPVIDKWTSSGTTLPSQALRGLAPTVGTLADAPSGTITPNAPSAQVFEITLGTTAGNRTIAVPTNPTDGQPISYRIKQNTNNTGTAVFEAGYKMNSGGTPTLGTTSSWNYVGFRYYAGGTVWHHQGNSLGIV
jgi:hypothetical protein